jgi:hypothetical protein
VDDVGELDLSENYGFEIGPFLSFIGLPNLKVFRVENDTIGEFYERPEDHPLNNQESHLTDLTLGVSCLHLTEML